MQAVTQRYQLSVGFEKSLGVRVTVIIVCGCLGVPAGGLLGFILGMLIMTLVTAGGPDPALTSPPWLPLVLAGLFSALLALYTVVTVAVVVRRSAWLEGARLTVRVLRKRTVDLSAAQAVALQPTTVRLAGSVPAGVWGNWPSGTIPKLVVETPTETVQMWLASRERVLLPSAQMVALAAVLSAATCPGATDVAEWLRGTAAHPRAAVR